MITLKELKSYSRVSLYEKFISSSCISKKINLDEILNILLKKNIINYDLNGNIKFNYVGFILVKDIFIFVKPKYIIDKNQEDSMIVNDIFELFKKFNQKEIVYLDNMNDLEIESDIVDNILLSLIRFLLDDYIENGFYRKEMVSYELNGDGDIDWDLTIDEINPLIIGKKSIYSDFITEESIIDNNMFLTKIHSCIINECISILNRTGLNNIFKYDIEENGSILDDIEDKNYIFYKIDNEINIQFIDKKIRVLKAMKLYLKKRAEFQEKQILLYGTRNFKWIWEVLCCHVFENEFIKDYNNSKYEKYSISSPEWIIYGSKINIFRENRNRLTPDILKIINYKNKKYLLILDAKYYNIKIEQNNIKGNPGIRDISKQYLYCTMLNKYIESEGIDKKNIINAFLFPTDLDNYLQGEVKLDFMEKFYENPIYLFKINVHEVINMYCNNKTYNLINLLENIFNFN